MNTPPRTPWRAPAQAAPLPPITFPESLPVSARRDEIAQALREHQVVIVCGETGSGKTTQLPKLVLALSRGRAFTGRLIGHTQPRRIAASSVAKRIAQELNSQVQLAGGDQLARDRDDEGLAEVGVQLGRDGAEPGHEGVWGTLRYRLRGSARLRERHDNKEPQ